MFDTRFLEHTPWLIYLRMLWEQYGEELMEEATDDRDVDRIHSWADITRYTSLAGRLQVLASEQDPVKLILRTTTGSVLAGVSDPP